MRGKKKIMKKKLKGARLTKKSSSRKMNQMGSGGRTAGRRKGK